MPGGRIIDTDYWVVEHCVGPLGIGTLILKPLRHCTGLADLNDEEAGELGPLLKKVCAAVTELADAEQVYSSLWSHSKSGPTHIHFVLQPIFHSMQETYPGAGPTLQSAQFKAGLLPEAAAVEEFCQRARAVFNSSVVE